MTKKLFYNKKPLSNKAKIDRLISKGIVVPCESYAMSFLEGVDYSRIKPYRDLYWDDVNEKVVPNTTFEDIVKMYQFDEELKFLLFKALVKIEVFAKKSVSNVLANLEVDGVKADPFAYEKEQIFYDFEDYDDRVLRKLKKYVKSACNKNYEPDPLIIKYKNRYQNYPSLPIWMAIEMFSFGMLSLLVKHLLFPYSKKIATDMSVPYVKRNEEILRSWLHAFSVLRNICAHHAPLICRNIKVKITIPNKWNQVNNKHVNSLIYAINQFLLAIPLIEDFHVEWRKDIDCLFKKFKTSEIKSNRKINVYELTKFDPIHDLWIVEK